MVKQKRDIKVKFSISFFHVKIKNGGREKYMTYEDLKEKLDEKLEAEFLEYIKELAKNYTPDEIIDKSYETTFKEQIIDYISCEMLSRREIKALLQKNNALDDLYARARKKYYNKNKNNNIKNKQKATGMRALYLYYCYLLKIYPKTNTKKKVPLSIRADVQKLHRISEEAKLLSRNNIQTTKQLSLYINTLKEEKQNLEEQRDKLYYENTKLKKEERQENYEKLSEIAGKIQFLKEEIFKCNEFAAIVNALCKC